MKALSKLFVYTAVAAAVCSTAYADNLVHNPNFNQPLAHTTPNSDGVVNTENSWIFYQNNGGSADVTVKDGKITGVSNNLGAPNYGAQLIQAPIKLVAGDKYTISFDASSAGGNSELSVKVGADASRQYYGYFVKSIDVTPETKRYTYEFAMKSETDPKARLEFWFAKAKNPVSISNVSLEKTGEITVKDRFGIHKFEPNKTFTTLTPNQNIFTDSMEKELVRGARVHKDITLSEDGRYKFAIDASASSNTRIEVGLRDGQGKVAVKKIITVTKESKAQDVILQFTGATTDAGEFFAKRISGGKLNVKSVEFSKYIGNLVWDDEFNTNGPVNSSKWSHDLGGGGWGNGEQQFYTRLTSNSYVKDGVLYIKAKRQRKGDSRYTSARLTTKGKGDWTYGRIEVKAKLPGGRGVWPAIWMLPTDNTYGIWPKSGEIDILEYVGFEPNKIHATIHDEKYSWLTSNQKTSELTVTPKDVQDKFNVYALEWTPELLKIYKDNTLYYTFKNEGTGHKAWPFNKPFHLLLNIAVGGSWGGVKGIDNSIFPQKMAVDYVRVYDLGIKK